MYKIVYAIGLLVLFSIPTQSMGAALLWIKPVASEVEVGKTVKIQLTASDVVDLYGLSIDIGFDPAVLEGVLIDPEDCPAPDFVVRNQIDNTSGSIGYDVTSLNPTLPCGGGTVASVTFKSLAEGKTTIVITSSILSNPDGVLITHSTQSGNIDVIKAVDNDDDFLLFLPPVLGGAIK